MVGFHGKLSGLGDFVQRRLPVEFVEPWDRGFRTALEGAAEHLGVDWRQRCLGAPVWRFALAAHVCGPRPWIGAVAPSSDRVGRVFPLVVAIAAEPAANGWPRLPGQAWFDGVEAVLLDGLRNGSLTDFDRAVSGLPGPASIVAESLPSPTGAAMRTRWWRGADPRRGLLMHGLPGAADYLRFIDGMDAAHREEST